VAGLKRSLAVDLGGLPLATPVVIASGCGGEGRELAGLTDVRKVGAIVTRIVTIAPRKGSPTPRISESASGVVWSTGLQNPGIESFVEDELPRMVSLGAPVIVSIAGETLEEFVRLASLLQARPGVVAIETQLSGPDVGLHRAVLGVQPERASEIVGAVARMSMIPVFAKLPPFATEIVEVAHACVRAGATGVTLVDAVPALAVDAVRFRPELGAVTGWLSGPAIRPIALRAIHEVAQAMPEVPIMGCGGVRSGSDAAEMMLAGAWAVQVGTATIVDASAPVRIATELMEYLRSKGFTSPNELRGRLRLPVAPEPAPTEGAPA
jgi:dihydroorotate dehydrogenase (NAD+) catalytic subunit